LFKQVQVSLLFAIPVQEIERGAVLLLLGQAVLVAGLALLRRVPVDLAVVAVLEDILVLAVAVLYRRALAVRRVLVVAQVVAVVAVMLVTTPAAGSFTLLVGAGEVAQVFWGRVAAVLVAVEALAGAGAVAGLLAGQVQRFLLIQTPLITIILQKVAPEVRMAGVLATMLFIVLAVTAAGALCVSYIPAVLAHSHQLVQGIYK
jgi:hypothetical protein